jgi:hypothetical protein
MGQQRRGNIEIGDDFYERYDQIVHDLAEAERDVVMTTDGLSALERRLMQDADEQFFKAHNKRLSESLQRREAKADPRYSMMIRAKAKAMETRTLLRGQSDIMQMKFREWQTRSANSRNSI